MLFLFARHGWQTQPAVTRHKVWNHFAQGLEPNVRGALLSIKSGQHLGAQALGFTRFQTIFWIIVPQAVHRALHGCGNEIIYLIKYSSLAFIVTCIELTGEGKTIATEYFRFTEVFALIGLYYLVLVTIAMFILKKIEKALHVPGFGRA